MSPFKFTASVSSNTVLKFCIYFKLRGNTILVLILREQNDVFEVWSYHDKAYEICDTGSYYPTEGQHNAGDHQI
jgi:hypothetical protein